ncbi:transcriptional regulator, MerR family [Alkalidesulfovibrio alkalitolerans DSM 16529]|uniref:Transcriptional regulator, MerR family n=1 Tax=Alkalidesulfovibrio alkalitolerans DSM 16529 TaxID=1121439 RepID=S7T2X9_9BACT|nr:transcriptional regulator, MerR family [Alkalidesulfovibrio alkalitolerans DSM 16529]
MSKRGLVKTPPGQLYIPGMEARTSQKTYKIGQAAKLLDLKPYVLRFWESEFPQIQPVRTDSGQRMYTEETIAVVRRIKHLLWDEGLTIEGARKALDGEVRTVLLRDIEAELLAIKADLAKF